MQEAYIVAGYRTAVGKAGKGGFRFMRPDDLAISVINHLMKSIPEFDKSLVDDCIVGCANPEGARPPDRQAHFFEGVGKVCARYDSQ